MAVDIKKLKDDLTKVNEELDSIIKALEDPDDKTDKPDKDAEGDEEKNYSLDELEDRANKLLERQKNLELQIRVAEKRQRTEEMREYGGPIFERGGKKDVDKGPGSELYKRAWLKKMATDDRGNMLFGELTKEERDAFIFTTANTQNVVPTDMQNRIIDRIKAEAPMMADATWTGIEKGFTIPVRTAIAQGDAAPIANEAGANDDEQDTFTLITMPGVDIKKHAIMSRRMKFMSIDMFESWLVEDLSKRITVAEERLALSRLDGTAPATGISANSSVAIAAANVLTGKSYTDAQIREIMALIDEPGQIVVYANRYTIYNGIAGIESGDGRKAFIDNPQEDPTVKGILYGATVKVDVNLSNNVAYFGVKGALKANRFAPVEVFPTVEAKTANTIYTGTEIVDAGLENPMAFVKVTFQ